MCSEHRYQDKSQGMAYAGNQGTERKCLVWKIAYASEPDACHGGKERVFENEHQCIHGHAIFIMTIAPQKPRDRQAVSIVASTILPIPS